MLVVKWKKLKKNVHGIFFPPDPDNGIKEPTIILSKELSAGNVEDVAIHELYHYATYLFIDTNKHKKLEKIKDDTTRYCEMIATIGELYGGYIQDMASFTDFQYPDPDTRDPKVIGLHFKGIEDSQGTYIYEGGHEMLNTTLKEIATGKIWKVIEVIPQGFTLEDVKTKAQADISYEFVTDKEIYKEVKNETINTTK